METLELSPVFEGLRFGEGPGWHDRRLWLSDIPNGRALAVDVTASSRSSSRSKGHRVLFFLDLADRAARCKSIGLKVDPFGDEDSSSIATPSLPRAFSIRPTHFLAGLA